MKSALIVIDFINDIVNPKGKIPSCAEQVKQHRVIECANQSIAWARKHGHLIIFVKVGFDPSYQDVPTFSPMFGGAGKIGALDLSGWGTAFHESLDVQPSDLVVTKPRVNPFYNTNLDSMLRANRINSVFLCGVSTSWAIQSATRDAHDRDYIVNIISDACASHTVEEHQNSLNMLERIATLWQSSALDDD